MATLNSVQAGRNEPFATFYTFTAAILLSCFATWCHGFMALTPPHIHTTKEIEVEAHNNTSNATQSIWGGSPTTTYVRREQEPDQAFVCVCRRGTRCTRVSSLANFHHVPARC